MTLTAREKQTVLIGAIVAAVLIGGSVVLAPLARRWGELGGELAPKLERVSALRQRAHRCDLLVARRNRLVRKLGSLLGAQATEKGNRPGPTGGPGPGGGPAAPAAQAAELSTGAYSFAAHLDRVAKSAKVKVKRISTKKRPSGEKGLRHFEPVALQVTAEGNVQALVKLLHGLEKGERLVRVERLNLSQDLKKRGALTITLDVVGYVPAGKER